MVPEAWIFTLGDPAEELLDQLADWSRSGHHDWLIVPIRTPGLESLRNPATGFVLGGSMVGL